MLEAFRSLAQYLLDNMTIWHTTVISLVMFNIGIFAGLVHAEKRCIELERKLKNQ